MSNKWDNLEAPPPPLFHGEKEKDFVKQINDELIERVIGQQVVYYPIDIENTKFHPVYGEAINKNFLPPLHVYAMVEWEGKTTETKDFGAEQVSSIVVHFHKRRLTEDQDLYVRIGDFVAWGQNYYEITSLTEGDHLWGQPDARFEITAKCLKARKSLFQAR